ncbi:DUF397 domain-containing protein [Streptomyces sp. NBC_01340]|uniref:DUF397 domain-containing protein n=1 Tax=unclassified Streptomyces TaxID=2593676 RepID=UPI00225170CD|nr:MULTISPECIES: DUF397 domain-containing protein [unclassified Streptomyces]MCX4455501.1 DUF397 domain-containing protein [Streptomyces sp. NBC_01719]MCX4494861.1 DUF397 domain-containing protein [Streptomyces sp. NBC_01728]MCX4590570.1 DUF397 domain-containing protein [Streptomyces sp. NBC_01549]WSI39888.1 DUF397 domain-containing protein [Streptomyces sp. NBC_01340]
MIQWQKSSFSGGAAGNECVELAHRDGTLLLRESDEPDRILPLSPVGLVALLRRIRAERP